MINASDYGIGNHGIPIEICTMMPEDKILLVKEPSYKILVANEAVRWNLIWSVTKNIHDYIEWRAAYYSQQINNKYRL